MAAPSVDDLTVDQSKVTGDGAEIYLLQWLSLAEKALLHLAVGDIKANQVALETTLTNIATTTAPFSAPGRPIRNLVARCLIALYTRAETRSMFDTLQSLSRVFSDQKLTDTGAKISSLYIMGEIMGTFGSQVMSFMGEIAISTVKIFRTSSNPVLLRYHALLALQKSLDTAARAVTDSLAKDILKHAKSGLSDKALPIQRASADVLRSMHAHGNALRTVSEIEAIVSLCVRSLDGADQQTRRSLAQLVAQILTFTQTEVTAPPPDASKKNGKKDKDADSDTETTARPTDATPQTLLPVTGMFTILSAWFNKPTMTRKTRIGIIDIYATLLASLGASFVETNYPVIVRHLLVEVATHHFSRGPLIRHDTLLLRRLTGVLLRDIIGVRMLSEQGQIGAIRELSSTYLSKWPALMPGHTAPTPHVLVIVLKEIAGLLLQLGNAPPPVQEVLSEPLIHLLSHPNHSTRIAAAWCLRSFCYSTPLKLPKSVLSVMELLQRDISSLSSPSAPADVHYRILGHAHGLAALITVIPERPLYVSYDLSAKVLDTAIQLIKRAGDHDIRVAGVEIEVAWTCVASLMTLGPNFVRAHLSQLLVLWRNALPKPTSKDTTNSTMRSTADWAFLLRVRESALGAIFSFLLHNSPALVTLDVARRLSSLLSNALNFANAFVSQYREDLIEQSSATQASSSTSTSSSELGLVTREAMLRRRVYQCFSTLGFSSILESTQSTLLQSAVTLFASPDGFAGSSAQAAIATSAGTFTSLWQMTDGYAYGVTGADLKVPPSPGDANANQEKRDHLNRDLVEVAIDEMISKPIIGSCEHDSLLLSKVRSSALDVVEPPPAATGAVDAAMELFSLLLPIQDVNSTTKIITQLVDFVRSPKLERNSGRKSAVFVNATAAIVLALRHATASHFRQARDSLGNSQVTLVLANFLKDAILDGDLALRFAGSEALGRLASLAGTSFLTGQITFLVDQVVSNRDPNGRAGCALAFGAIYSQVGGLAAGPLLKTTVNVLMSLSNDPHPVVHYWALTALGQVINAASLSYSPFLSSTLGMLFKLYTMDTHEPEGGSLANTNLRGDLPAYQVICQIIDGVIGVLGPELQESTRTRTLVLDLVQEFSHEVDDGIRVESIKCIQHFLIFGSNFLEVSDLVKQFRAHLSSSRRPLKMASINALYALVQKDAFTMSKVGGDRLVADLFGMLDDDSSIEGVRNVITSWLQQTVSHNPSGWINLCQRIMSRTNAFQQSSEATAKGQAMQDDEGESLSVGMAKEQPALGGRGHATSRWRTQLFALQCLHMICATVAASGRREQVDLRYARQQEVTNESSLLVSRVPDLIKMAFTASAAYVTEIRLEGLVVLRDVIEIFALSPDPDYESALLLEQHQAPITAALTPAFSSDSTPEILSAAIEACAVFVGCGVVKDVGRMGRILKLLTSALEQCKQSGTLSIGDAQELSPNASVMLRVSTLTAWAELEVASGSQAYLKAVLQPYRAILASLWVASLRDYASIRADSEVLQESASGAMDVAYTGLGREVLLPYYTDSWAKILRAVATAMQSEDKHILAALDGEEDISAIPAQRTSSVAYYPVIFGLVYEALVTGSTDSSSNASTRYSCITALHALKSLVRPEYSGNTLFEPAIFDEFSALCYRMSMTEPPDVQLLLVEVIVSLVRSRDAISLRGPGALRSFPEDLPLTHCLRICAYVLRHAMPDSRGGAGKSTSFSPIERVTLINSGFAAFSIIGDAFGPSLREDVRAIAVTLYASLLKDELSEVDLAGPSLPALKSMLERRGDNDPSQDEKYEKLVHGLLSACLQNMDEMSGRRGPIPVIKTKNIMLASVLILTVVPPGTKLSQAALEHCCYLISQTMGKGDESSVTAAHCAKTLVAAAAVGNQALQHCVKLLLPGMISYVANIASATTDSSDAELKGLEEILKAFSALSVSFPEAIRGRAYGVIMPVLIILLDSAGSPPYNLAVGHLLAFATSSPAAFKEATGKLEAREREALETAVRQAVTAASQNITGGVGGQGSKPQISLRTF